jgi:hypothetical protein
MDKHNGYRPLWIKSESDDYGLDFYVKDPKANCTTIAIEVHSIVKHKHLWTVYIPKTEHIIKEIRDLLNGKSETLTVEDDKFHVVLSQTLDFDGLILIEFLPKKLTKKRVPLEVLINATRAKRLENYLGGLRYD